MRHFRPTLKQSPFFVWFFQTPLIVWQHPANHPFRLQNLLDGDASSGAEDNHTADKVEKRGLLCVAEVANAALHPKLLYTVIKDFLK